MSKKTLIAAILSIAVIFNWVLIVPMRAQGEDLYPEKTFILPADGNWTGSGQVTYNNGVLNFTGISGLPAMATYNGDVDNKLVQVVMSADVPSDDGWMGFLFRQSETNKIVWEQEYAYSILIMRSEIHIVKALNRQLYTLHTVRNATFTDGMTHKVRAGVIDDGPNVRLILDIDGQNIINFLDSSNPIKSGSQMTMAAINSTRASVITGQKIDDVQYTYVMPKDKNWTLGAGSRFEGSALHAESGNGIDYAVATYNGSKLVNKLPQFYLSINMASGQWLGIFLRQSDPGKIIWEQQSAYGVLITDNGEIEIVKRKDGAMTTISRTPNSILKDGKEHKIRVGALDVNENSVKIVVDIDGENIVSFVDGSNPIKTQGYMSIVPIGGTKATLRFESDHPYEDLEQYLPLDENWVVTNPGRMEGDSISIPSEGGVVSYKGTAIENRLATFTASYNLPQNSWMGLILNGDAVGQDLFAQNNAYAILFTTNGEFHLLKITNKNINTIHISPTIDIVNNKKQTISVGAVAEGDNIRILLVVDNRVALNYLDTSSPIKNAPSFSVTSFNGATVNLVVGEYVKYQDETVKLPATLDWQLGDGASIDKNILVLQAEAGKSSLATFKGAELSKKIVEFDYKQKLGSDGTVSFIFRQDEPGQAVSSLKYYYAVTFKADGSVEITKNLFGAVEKILAVSYPEIDENTFSRLRIGTLDDKYGVKIYLEIDGAIVAEFLDEQNLVKIDSYISIAAAGTAKATVKLLESSLPDSPDYDPSYIIPYWYGNVVKNESLMIVKNQDGSIPPAPLLYTPSRIVLVRSADLKTVYVEGSDWELVDGKIVIPNGSRIPVMEYDQYYPKTAGPNALEKVAGGYIYFSEGPDLHLRQIVVTYEHQEEWEGTVPLYKGNMLPKTISKLVGKEKLNIVFYGDSITTGANSSSVIGAEPYLPKWTDMLVDYLKSEYENPNITSVNTAKGGETSVWGLQNVKPLVIDKNPDLVFIAFGMNDGSGSAIDTIQYLDNIRGMINQVRAANPDCEFVLVSPILPNPEVAMTVGIQDRYEAQLKKLEGNGVVVAEVTTMHKLLLEKKRYYDMTGNNVNHPNDFLARLYTQVCASILSTKFQVDTDPESLIHEIPKSRNWLVNAGALIDSNMDLQFGINANQYGIATYRGCRMTNKLATFQLKIENIPTDWFGIALRQSNTGKLVWEQESCYAFLIKNNGEIHLLKSQNHVMETVNVISDNTLLDGQTHKISAGAVDEKGGVRLILEIDDGRVIDYFDNTKPILNSSYMTLISLENTIATAYFTGEADDCGDHEPPIVADNEFSYLGGEITGYRNIRPAIVDDERLFNVSEQEEDSYIGVKNPQKPDGPSDPSENPDDEPTNDSPATGDKALDLVYSIFPVVLAICSVTLVLTKKREKSTN